jgi:two-component system sensor histidine kinase UhpB
MAFGRRSLFWRVFATNALVFGAGGLALGLSPLTVSTPIALTEAVVLALGLGVMLVANMLLLRPAFVPLEELARRMDAVDLLRPGGRMRVSGHGEVPRLMRAFNRMLDRLESERREAGGRALAAQEAERLRIAQGLHDEVGQAMTGVLLQLKRLEADMPERHRATLAETQHTVRETLDEVRRIAQELRPENLESLGLVSALKVLASGFAERTGIAVDASFGDRLPALDPGAELAVYRVVQESLTNVGRHAGAESVTLTVAADDGSLLVCVEDDGRGPARLVEGSGLRGMRERAVMIGADLVVRPRREGGTEVRLVVPAGTGR